jgi:glucose-6-phosphate dehydrogenase assembly protein OpcA
MKRRYTVSERSRQASRENLAWARLAGWQKMQAPGYQPSPRRLAANRANLMLGVEAKRRDDSAGYASCFRDGLRPSVWSAA